MKIATVDDESHWEVRTKPYEKVSECRTSALDASRVFSVPSVKTHMSGYLIQKYDPENSF